MHGLAETTAACVRHHHERWDGGGYPDGLAGENIPLHARIIRVADVFDALTSTRSYRKAFSWEKALEILKEEAGTKVDPRLQQAFDTLIRVQIENRPDGWAALIWDAEACQDIALGAVWMPTGG